MFRTAATKIAHNSTIPALAGNQDLRPLQDLITAEKAVLISLQKLSVDFSKASEALRTWGLNEGDDLGDILSGSTTLLSHFSSALSQYASHGHVMRDQLKAIRTREEALEELKRRRRTLMRKAEDAEKKLSKMSPEHKNLGVQTETLNRLRDEIRSMDTEIMTEEAALGDFKRTTTRSCMGLKFGGLLECCEKGAIVAEFGKMLIADVSEEVTQPGLPRSMYYGHSKTEGIVADAHRCVNEVALSTIPSAAIRDRQQYTSQAAPQIPEQSSGQPVPGENYGFNPGATPVTESKPPAPYPVQYTESENPSNYDAPRSPTAASRPSLGSQPISSYHQQEYTGGSMLSQPRLDLPPQIMDDFGVSPRSAGVLDGSNASGGRFATFPVKNQGYMLQDPPRQPEQEKSFSASIAEALDGQGPPPPPSNSLGQGSQNQTSPPWNPRNVSGSPPLTQYEFSPPPPNNILPSISSASGSPLPPPPPGAAPPDLSKSWNNPSITETAQLGQRSTISGDNINDALLAYMTTAEADEDSRTDEEPFRATGNEQATLGVQDYQDEQHRISRHVRFGQVEDAQEHREKKVSLEKERQANIAGVVETHFDEPARPTDDPEMSPTRGSSSQKRVPPPVFQPEEDEKSLNAAAAREVAKELEAMKVSSSIQGEQTLNQRQPAPEFHSNSGRGLPSLPPDAYSGQGSSQLQREPSPLLPPSAPITARSVSPHLYGDISPNSAVPGPYGNQYNPVQPYTQPSYGSSPPNISPAQTYAQSYQSYIQPATSDVQAVPSSMPPRFQALNQSSDNVVPPRFQGNLSYSQASPISSQVPPRFQAGGSPKVPQQAVNVPEAQEDSSRSTSTWKPLPESGSTPYRTPPEYPRQLGSGSPFAKSNTSLNTSVPGSPLSGPRTISAAAFKRPRNASTDNQGTSGEFVKKSLPSSPYPNRQDASDRNQSMGGAGSSPFPNTSQNADNTDDDQYDYINAYVNNSNPNSPSKTGFGNPTSSSVAPAGSQPGGGYGEGRYATDTEGQLR